MKLNHVIIQQQKENGDKIEVELICLGDTEEEVKAIIFEEYDLTNPTMKSSVEFIISPLKYKSAGSVGRVFVAETFTVEPFLFFMLRKREDQ